MHHQQATRYKCKICARDSYFNFYGVRSCEGCKQFFRRAIIKQQFFLCVNESKCNILAGVTCRGCRLDKCLIAGMDPRMVQTVRNNAENARSFLVKIEKRQMELVHRQEQIQSAALNDAISDVYQLVKSLSIPEQACKRIWESTRTLPPEYTNRHANIRGLLEEKGNLLEMTDYFKNDEPNWDKTQFLEEIETKGLLFGNYMQIVIKDWFFCVKMAKTFPFFNRLETDDQVVLLQHIMTPLYALFASHYSHSKSAKTITRANGLTPVSMLETAKYRDDQTLKAIYQQVNCEAIEKMELVGIGHDEFLLLLALLFSTSTAENLTDSGRELLYAQSVHYSKALHQLLQAKLGPAAAAQKFAQAMGLLDVVFKAKSLIAKLVIYMEVFYDRKNSKQVIPRALEFCALE